MNDNVLVNNHFDDAITKYILLSKSGDLENCNDFLIKVINCLVFIYGDLDLTNPHITKDTKTLIENLAKYGYPKNDITNFICEVSLKNNCDDVIIANNLIDMFYLKSKVSLVTEFEKRAFLRLLDDLFKSQEVLNYFERKFNEKEITNDIEFLEIETDLFPKETKKRLSFQFGAASGYVSIMTILITIALVCIGITIVNVLVG